MVLFPSTNPTALNHHCFTICFTRLAARIKQVCHSLNILHNNLQIRGLCEQYIYLQNFFWGGGGRKNPRNWHRFPAIFTQLFLERNQNQRQLTNYVRMNRQQTYFSRLAMCPNLHIQFITTTVFNECFIQSEVLPLQRIQIKFLFIGTISISNESLKYLFSDLDVFTFRYLLFFSA